MLGLKSRTDPDWATVALRDEIALLRDHAHLERKAAGHVLTLIGQTPGGQDRLLEVAKEELQHFEIVCDVLRRRGAVLGPDPGNPYVQALAKGPSTLLDRVLRMGIIEARSYEHFCLLADAATSGDVRDLFASLKDSEAGHHAFFIKLAHEHWPRDDVRERWDALAEREAAILASLEWGPRVH